MELREERGRGCIPASGVSGSAAAQVALGDSVLSHSSVPARRRQERPLASVFHEVEMEN